MSLASLIHIIILVSAFLVLRNWRYKKGAYYQITRNTYGSVRFDKGKYAEYLIYESLRYFENHDGKFLFNVLIPKENGETTEIDVLLICAKGIFVFESKNYSGWIFGNAMQKSWTQVLPLGRRRSHKERFYNPIMQNASHVRYLKKLISPAAAVHSVIVFSNRCTLKDVSLGNSNVIVVYLHQLKSTIKRIYEQTSENIYTTAEVNSLYSKLYPYSQYDNILKEQHITRISRNEF